jgi:dihydrolipoamide dehydrogenase
MADKNYDLVVIGGGPAGYTGSIRAAQLGLKTAIIEKRETLGGTCLNVGCVPSKALLDSSELFHQAQHDFDTHGIGVSALKLDLKKMMGRKDKVVKDLTEGIKFLMGKNKIDHFHGLGKILSANEVEVTTADGKTEKLNAKSIMIATGSDVVELPFLKYDGENVISSTEALELSKVPKHMVIVGAGVIGLEMGSVWSRLGAKVTVIEYADRIAGAMDSKLSKVLQRTLAKQGMEFVLSAKVTGAEIKGKGKITVNYELLKDNSAQSIECDKVLVSVGRRPYTDGLGLENVGIELNERGQIPVNTHLQTKVANIYATGDAVPGAMLAHKAEEEGVAVAEFIATGIGHVNYETVPWVIYTWPELAGVGKTEDELKAEGVPYKAGQFPFTANARAKAMNCTDGMVKVLAHKDTDRILGVHILGPRASDMIAEAVVAMEFAGSAEDLARSFHGHPTLSEVMREAALAVDKRARQS